MSPARPPEGVRTAALQSAGRPTSLGLLFPGQGTQHVGMLPWLASQPAARDVLGRLAERLGADWRERLHDTDWSTRNAVAQVLLTGTSLAAWSVLAPLLPPPTAIAGYSVGELAAFSAAGVFSATEALALAAERARIMDSSVGPARTGLLSVAGLSPTALIELQQRHRLQLAIRLALDRCILGGLHTDLAAAQSDADSLGASCQRLAVSLASHTGWLSGAVAPLAQAIDALAFRTPRAALVCNDGASVLRREAELRHALAAQVASPVHWDDCMDALAERGVRCVLEVGPGTSLARLWNARHPGIPARSLEDFQQPAAIASWVGQHVATS